MFVDFVTVKSSRKAIVSAFIQVPHATPPLHYRNFHFTQFTQVMMTGDRGKANLPLCDENTSTLLRKSSKANTQLPPLFFNFKETKHTYDPSTNLLLSLDPTNPKNQKSGVRKTRH